MSFSVSGYVIFTRKNFRRTSIRRPAPRENEFAVRVTFTMPDSMIPAARGLLPTDLYRRAREAAV